MRYHVALASLADGAGGRAGEVYDPDTDNVYFATCAGPFDADLPPGAC